MNHKPLLRLANLIALQTVNAELKQRFIARLRATLGCRVLEPAQHWVIGIIDLPWSSPPDPRDELGGCFLVEGQELLPSMDAARKEMHRHLHNTTLRPATFSDTPDDISFLSVRPDGHATFLRSLGGRIPGYWWPTEGALYLSTSSTLLVTLAGHDAQPDPLITALQLAGNATNSVHHRSHLKGTFCLNKAEALSISATSQTAISQYWQPLPIDAVRWPKQQQIQTHAAQFKELLVSNLEQGLTSTGHNLLTLSGGIDSSLLLAISVGMLKRPINTASIIPTLDDPVWSREMTRHAWLQQQYPTQSQINIVTDDNSQLTLRDALQPAAITMFNPTMASLSVLNSENAPCVSFGGEQADEVAGSRFLTRAEWVLQTPRWRVALCANANFPADLKRMEVMLRPKQLKQRLLRDDTPLTGQLPQWLHRNIHEEWAELRPMLQKQMLKIIDSTANAFSWLSHTEVDWQAMQWEWASAQGVHRINPFSSSRILALSLKTHPVERLGHEDKRLIRNAFAGQFPSPLLARQDKGFFGKPTEPPLLSTLSLLKRNVDPVLLELIDPAYLFPNRGSAARAQDNSMPWMRKAENDQLTLFTQARAKIFRRPIN